MKHLFGLISVMMMTATVIVAKDKEPVVMKINGTPVSQAEFEYFYNKNNQQELAEEKNFDEYVDLFINYKLKVCEAVARGIDTTRSYRDELAGYRSQLAEPYLRDTTWQDSLVNEVLDRRKIQVSASHILVTVDQNASAEQVKAAEEKILGYKAQVEAGASFDSLARAVSEDPSARQNKGRLGYFSAMQMVYSFENAAFNAPVGGLAVCRSRFGYHLIKVHDRRPSLGEVRVAHIMKAFIGGKREPAKAAIDSLYNVLKGGADFARLAQTNSDDQYTAPNGGEYPWLGASAQFPPEWLSEAFALQNEGDYTKPFSTDFGWHILRLLGKRDEMPVTDEMRAQMKEMMGRDPERAAVGKRLFIDRLTKEYGMNRNTKTKASIVKLMADTTMTKATFVSALGKMKKPLLVIGKEKYTVADFAVFVDKEVGNYARMNLDEQLEAWSEKMLLDYEDRHLEEKYADFRNLYKEYRDGILLFDVSSKEVWDKAAADTVGLTAYFERNRSKYAWDFPRFKGAFVECHDNDTLVSVLKSIYDSVGEDAVKASEIIKATVLTDSVLTPNRKTPPFHIVNGIFSRGDNDAVDVIQLKCKDKFQPRADMPVVMTFGKILHGGPECVDDVRGQVIADYQLELEKLWVAQLRAKYEVEINHKVLDKIKQQQ